MGLSGKNAIFIIRLSIYLVLIGGFGWQVLDQIEKFFQKKTTMASRLVQLFSHLVFFSAI